MKASACQVSNGVWYNSFCCAGGRNPGVSVPPVTSPPSSSPSHTGPAAVSSPEAETEDGVRRGSRAGLTLWPPAAGAEAATRPASLKKGGEGSVATNTKGKLRCCVFLVFYFSTSHLPHSLLLYRALFLFSLLPTLMCRAYTGNDNLAIRSGSEPQWTKCSSA